nr:core-binding factor subunit beta-like isoform X2 [Paramormyrops kingsleyae]
MGCRSCSGGSGILTARCPVMAESKPEAAVARKISLEGRNLGRNQTDLRGIQTMQDSILFLCIYVYLKAPMILNGVCVIWRGWIDLQRLDGMGCLEYDDEKAQQEDSIARQAFEEARRRAREFEDRNRSHCEDMERQQDSSPGSTMGNSDDRKIR